MLSGVWGYLQDLETRRQAAIRGHACPRIDKGVEEMLKDLMTRAWQAVWRWQQRRRTLSQLEALDDRMLKDIGLYRGQLPGEVERRIPPLAAPPFLLLDAASMPHGQANEDAPRRGHGLKPAA
jgi:uncharacterized protein YjiS (DUF1127 family)